MKTQAGSETAIALYYDGENAPNVAAKGTGPLAERILQLAREHGVPTHEDETLTRLLMQVPLGEEIPPQMYVAVAEVLAFTFCLAGITPDQHRRRLSKR
jgi:flagellar biosynthesis protein